jgi:parallel beta-helix repeat protein
MKKRTIIIALITLLLAPTLFSNTIIASAQTYGSTQTTYTISSSGTIQSQSPNNATNATALILQIKDGYYQVINTATQEPIIGGPDNLAGVNGTSFSAVAQAAENSLQTGGSLEIAAGNYISDGTVSIKGNTTILGQGDSTFIQQKAGIATHISLLDVTRTSNVEIFNLWLDGNRANQFDTGDEMRHGIITFVAQNVWIHNVKVTNFTETGWDSAWCNNCTIENSILTGSGDGDIWIDIDSTHQIARNNICNKIFAVDFGGLMKNIEITSNQANFIELYQGNTGVPRDITLSDNTIIASEMFGIYTQGCLNVIIRNNTVIGNWGFTDTGILIACGANFTITSNTVTNCGNGVKSGTYSTPSQHTIIKNDLKMNKIPINDNITQTMDYIKYNLGVDISSWDEIP